MMNYDDDGDDDDDEDDDGDDDNDDDRIGQGQTTTNIFWYLLPNRKILPDRNLGLISVGCLTSWQHLILSPFSIRSDIFWFHFLNP